MYQEVDENRLNLWEKLTQKASMASNENTVLGSIIKKQGRNRAKNDPSTYDIILFGSDSMEAAYSIRFKLI